MQRIFVLAMILWLGAFGAVSAQTSPQSGQFTSTPDNAAAVAAGSTAIAGAASGGTSFNGTAFPDFTDPLNVPTANAPAPFAASSAGSAGGIATGAPGISASPSISPQRAVQLPGEQPNTSTEAPNTTASAPAASSGFSGLSCSATIPTTAGSSSMTGIFGGGLSGGC
jgi:hypothetical protein